MAITNIPRSYHGDPAELFDAVAVLTRRPAWHADALCREHPEIDFFPVRGESVEAAKAVCARCLVRDECLATALAMCDSGLDGAVGIWGGTSQQERVQLRRQRFIVSSGR